MKAKGDKVNTFFSHLHTAIIFMTSGSHGQTGQGTVSLRLMTSQYKDIVNHTQNKNQKNAYFAVYGLEIVCEIAKVPFEISHKIWSPYTAKYAFYDVLKVWRIVIF